MSRAPIYIVCSPHGKTGASTVTRLLCDFLTFEQRAFALFDTDPHSRALGGWFPRACTIADITTTRGQIALFDQIVMPGDAPRVVEVPSHLYARFFTQVRDIELFEEALRCGLDPIVLYVSNGSDIAVEAARALQGALRDAILIPVVNEGPVRLGSRLQGHLDDFESSQSFEIPALASSSRDVIESPQFSLSRFLAEPPPDRMSLVVRADLRNWIKRVFTQFRAYEVRKAFDQSSYLLNV